MVHIEIFFNKRLPPIFPITLLAVLNWEHAVIGFFHEKISRVILFKTERHSIQWRWTCHLTLQWELMMSNFGMTGNFRIFAASNSWQNGWPTDAPECPRSSSDVAGDCRNNQHVNDKASENLGLFQSRRWLNFAYSIECSIAQAKRVLLVPLNTS